MSQNPCEDISRVRREMGQKSFRYFATAFESNPTMSAVFLMLIPGSYLVIIVSSLVLLIVTKKKLL